MRISASDRLEEREPLAVLGDSCRYEPAGTRAVRGGTDGPQRPGVVLRGASSALGLNTADVELADYFDHSRPAVSRKFGDRCADRNCPNRIRHDVRPALDLSRHHQS